MARSNGGSTVEKVWDIAKPVADSLGLKLWDIRFLKEGASWYLRIYIDKDGGVSIDDCENMSRGVDKPLDTADPIEQSYYLEVSSPGIERELTRQEHFKLCMGQKIKLRTIRPHNNKRDFSGVLEGYDAGNVTIRLEDGSGICLNKKETSFIKLDDFDI
ncbi:MAG: ribosome maturation factor RimP [Clostridiales bacterium]|jgi:ribosome maturation factor RimP|nr:ribosome maturation factor RimP [Clostridiales bacterium]